MGDGCGVRKFWVVGGIGIGLAMCFMALLVVGTYSAAAGLGSAGSNGAVGLAKGAVPAKYQPLVQKWGNLCPAINPALLAAQLYQESGWNPRAQSPAAAQGIAQFIPGTWAASRDRRGQRRGPGRMGSGRRDSVRRHRTTANSPGT